MKERNDEFFTSLKEIEKELPHYKKYFRDKIVFCPANDNTESGFFKFFKKNFHSYRLKTLYCLSLKGVLYIYNGENLEVKELSTNGDFRCEESIKILKKSDIIVTNPPFSLFLDFFSLLIKYDKKFLIIGNHICGGYKEIFPYIKDRKVWQGVNIPKIFYNSKGEKQPQVAGLCRWFTNLKHKKEKPFLTLKEEYNPLKHPKYDNCEAIDCKEIKNIPKDYFSLIGVPVSFLDKWNPLQFSIVGIRRNTLKINDERQPPRILIAIKKYSSTLSVEEIAQRQNLSCAAIRKHILKNKIPRREEKKLILQQKINSLLEKNPNNRRAIAKQLNISPTTLYKYLKKSEPSIEVIDFEKIEEYSGENLIAFSKGNFKYRGENIGFGNMKNFPIEFFSEKFPSIEHVYIACAYGKNTKECIEIQRQIQSQNNALLVKRKFRHNSLEEKFARKDFHPGVWKLHLMLYLVYHKCLQHKEFAQNLLHTQNSIIIEDQSRHIKVKQGDWGAKNEEAKQEYYNLLKSGQSQNLAAINSWKKGVWRGKNYQGKILMACRQALKNNTLPPIDKERLNQAEIYLFEKKLIFK